MNNALTVYNPTNNITWTSEEIDRRIEEFRGLLWNLGFECNPIVSVEISKRLKKSLGMTRRQTVYGQIVFSMAFSYDFLSVASEHNINTCIAHECIHLIDRCFNHKEKFKYVASLLIPYGYDVQRTLTDNSYKTLRIEARKNHIVYQPKCRNCGQKFHSYAKLSKTAKHIIAGNKRYYCTKCKSRDLVVEKIYPDGLIEELHSISL